MIWTPYIYERNFIKDVGIESRDDPWKIIFDIGTKYLWHLFIIYQLIFDSCKNNPLDCCLSFVLSNYCITKEFCLEIKD